MKYKIVFTLFLLLFQSVAVSDHYACFKDAKRFFSNDRLSSCSVITHDEGWTTIYGSTNAVVNYYPESLQIDGDIRKMWLDFYLADTYPDVFGNRFKYNRLRGAYKYDCKNRQYMLIQGTYYLNDSVVYERSDQEAVTEEIEPNTMSESILRKFCIGGANKTHTNKIPDVFLGSWAKSVEACNRKYSYDSDQKIRITKSNIEYYESHGIVRDVNSLNTNEIEVQLSMTGEGEKWTDNGHFIVAADRSFLVQNHRNTRIIRVLCREK